MREIEGSIFTALSNCITHQWTEIVDFIICFYDALNCILTWLFISKFIRHCLVDDTSTITDN